MIPWGSFFGLFIGLIMIIKGADIFTDAAVWIAKRTGIPKVIIGITIVSLATTLPEFAVSVFASYSNHVSMAVGNAVGSCICNIGLILGIVLILKSFNIDRSVFYLRAIYMIFVSLVLLALSVDLIINRSNAFLLLALLITFIFFIYNELKNLNIKDEHREVVKGSWHIQAVKFILSSLIVVIGSRLVVNSGVIIAEFFHIPEIVISLTLIALGTSLPELVTSVTAALKGHQELSLGNIVGANILNLTWVIGAAALVNPLTLLKSNIYIDLPIMLLLMVLLVVFGLTKKRLGRLEGIALFLIYIGYITFTVFS